MVFLNMKWSRGYQRMISYHLVHDIFNDRVTRTKYLQHEGLQKSLSFQLYSSNEWSEFGKNFKLDNINCLIVNSKFTKQYVYYDEVLCCRDGF